jgi:hypothetical protein
MPPHLRIIQKTVKGGLQRNYPVFYFPGCIAFEQCKFEAIGKSPTPAICWLVFIGSSSRKSILATCKLEKHITHHPSCYAIWHLFLVFLQSISFCLPRICLGTCFGKHGPHKWTHVVGSSNLGN